MSNEQDDHLAYGDYHGGARDESGERGLIGDFGRRLLGQGPEAEPSVSPAPPQLSVDHDKLARPRCFM